MPSIWLAWNRVKARSSGIRRTASSSSSGLESSRSSSRLKKYPVVPRSPLANLPASVFRLLVCRPARIAAAERQGRHAERQHVDAAIALTGRRVARHRRAAGLVGVPRPAPWRRAGFQRGDDPVGDFLVVVARRAVALSALRFWLWCWFCSSGCPSLMGFWNTPPAPRPGCPGQGRASCARPQAGPLRRADGDAVGDFLFRFDVFDFRSAFSLFFILAGNSVERPAEEGREAGRDPALRHRRHRAQRVVPVVQARPAAGSCRTAPRPPSPSPRAWRHSAGRRCRRRSRRSACRPVRPPDPAEAVAARRWSPGPSRRRSRHRACRAGSCSIAARLRASIAASHTATRRQADRAARQAEQRLVAARREIAPVGPAHLDPGQASRRVPVREPGAAVRAFADGVGRACCREGWAPAIPAAR